MRWFFKDPKGRWTELPNIQSAKKRVKVSEKKNLRNRIVKSGMRTSIRKFDAAVASDPSSASEQLSATSAVIDKAASKGVIHKNAANRKKARLAKQLNKSAAVWAWISRVINPFRSGRGFSFFCFRKIIQKKHVRWMKACSVQRWMQGFFSCNKT